MVWHITTTSSITRKAVYLYPDLTSIHDVKTQSNTSTYRLILIQEKGLIMLMIYFIPATDELSKTAVVFENDVTFWNGC